MRESHVAVLLLPASAVQSAKDRATGWQDDMLRYHDQTCISDNTQLSPQACATAVDVALRGDVQSCLVLRRDGLASVGSSAGWQLGRGLV